MFYHSLVLLKTDSIIAKDPQWSTLQTSSWSKNCNRALTKRTHCQKSAIATQQTKSSSKNANPKVIPIPSTSASSNHNKTIIPITSHTKTAGSPAVRYHTF